MVADQASFAQQVCDLVASRFPVGESPDDLRLYGAWVIDADRIAVVYSGFGRRLVGLDIALKPECGVESEVGRILDANIGEPLGSFGDEAQPDAHGVSWWAGEPAEWYP